MRKKVENKKQLVNFWNENCDFIYTIVEKCF